MPPKRVWEGAPALRRFLVAIDSLEPFPGNPRRGDVEKIGESLREFGQVRPILVDGARIVAGHHVVESAAEILGWTHVAAIPNEFRDEDAQRRYLLADNRLSELGSIDDGLLAVQLEALQSFEGTGYSTEDKAELDARLAQLRNPVFPETEQEPPPLDTRSPTTGVLEVPLHLDKETRAPFARFVKMLEREWEVEGLTAVVVRAVREAAERL